MTSRTLEGKNRFAGISRMAKSITMKSAALFFPEKVIRSVMSNIKVGCIEVESPDSGKWTLGHPESSPKCRVRVHRKALFENLVQYWDVGLGESYQLGDYDVDDLVALDRKSTRLNSSH